MTKESQESAALSYRLRYRGLIGVKSKMPIKDEVIYGRLYSPEAVVQVCQKIIHDPMKAYDYTCKNNLVAIVSDGSAVLKSKKN